MGSSAKKKKEKKKDFQKPKLKVGKARPKNTNATDTSFSAKSIVFKQQSLSEAGRDATGLFQHNLSLLGSKNETQRRDALAYITTVCSTQDSKTLPQPPSVILMKAQPLVLDGNSQVRQQLLKLLRSLPADSLGPIDQLLLYARAGMAHLSNDIRMTSLDVLDWLLGTNADAVVASAGGWVKTLRTFQNLLSWHQVPNATNTTTTNGTWSTSKPAANLGSSKLLVHQLTTLSHLLTAGLRRPSFDQGVALAAKKSAASFPIWHLDAHALPNKSNPFGYLNLFGVARDVESEIYEEAEERAEVFGELDFSEAFTHGVKEAKKEAGERLFRCTADELDALKLAFREQMGQTRTNGKAFLGQLPSEIDEDGTIREQMWQKVAASRVPFDAMLCGARWADAEPDDFEAQLQKAKSKICHDHTVAARRPHKRSREESSDVELRAIAATTSEGPATRSSKRLQRAAVGMPYPLRLASVTGDKNLVEQVVRIDDTDTGDVEHAIELRAAIGSTNTTDTDQSVVNGSAARFEDTPPTSAGSEAEMTRRTIQIRDRNHSSESIYHAGAISDEQSQAMEVQEPARPPLSVRIQQVVDQAIGDLAARVLNLEKVVPLDTDLDQRETVLEMKVMERVEALLAVQDAEIQSLRSELETERSWRTS
ncbi:rRNA processing protein [Vermiconidia calcicola]|uniref:rRNA processing protein n=1 Tax=Vermiconidia calcicola TaxID=1690605 RepID=A0ACC3MJL7_9PEZI|nr:rRNA processing protein [Vermiconidia calcicola]